MARRPFLIGMLDGKGGALPDVLESLPAADGQALPQMLARQGGMVAPYTAAMAMLAGDWTGITATLSTA